MFQGKHVLKDFPKENFNSPHLQRGKDIHKELENAVAHGTPIHMSRIFLKPLVDAIRRQNVALVEMQLCFDAGFGERTWFDTKNAWVRMGLDLTTYNDETFIIVIDWKSGKVRRDSKDQLRLFAGGAFKKYPKAKKVLTAYFWTDHPLEAPLWAEYTRDQCDEIWQEFGDRSELIQLANESGNWPEKPTYKCMFCPAEIGQCSNMTPELKEKRRVFEAKRG
jgi:hypothetical protein